MGDSQLSVRSGGLESRGIVSPVNYPVIFISEGIVRNEIPCIHYCSKQAMEASRISQIEVLAGDGDLEGLRQLLEPAGTQEEYNTALIIALAYSKIPVAAYALSKGADISCDGYDGVYHAVSNNELTSLQFAINQGVDINIKDGMLINAAIEMSINAKDLTLITWMLENGADTALLSSGFIAMAKEYGSEALINLLKQYGSKL